MLRAEFEVAAEGLLGLVARDGHDGQHIGAGEVVVGAE